MKAIMKYSNRTNFSGFRVYELFRITEKLPPALTKRLSHRMTKSKKRILNYINIEIIVKKYHHLKGKVKILLPILLKANNKNATAVMKNVILSTIRFSLL